MIDRLIRAVAFACYQLTIAIGILMLPVALAASRIGLRLPVHRLVQTAETVYERQQASADVKGDALAAG